MDVRDAQRERLRDTISWAREIGTHLRSILAAHGARVHFRPSSGGLSMVGLLPDRPQRGQPGIRDAKRLAAEFEQEFRIHCLDVTQGRPTPEKELQSYLISQSQQRDGWMVPLNATANFNHSAGEGLLFVTDEIALPYDAGKIVCDLLALRVGNGAAVPVVVELKSQRELTRLVEQVTGYATLVDQHADLFSELFSTLVNRSIGFTGPYERWIVWPAATENGDPRADEMRTKGIRLATYKKTDGGFSFWVAAP